MPIAKDTRPAWGKAADLEPDSWVSLYNLGIAYTRTGRYKEAADALRTAHELDPKNPRIKRALDSASALSLGR
ncbi:MAG: tetratricopeptide repeat protein [Planctomycetes bacterium]|nr:tetratricopeptide repeat protein [Planctomycetota bacterium]